MPEGTNSFDVGFSCELLGELVLVGIECLVKMGGLDTLMWGRNGESAEEFGSTVTDFGTKLAAAGFSLAVMVTVLE